MTENEKANNPEETTETQTDDKTKQPKKKMKLWKVFLILMAFVSIGVYLTHDPVKDATDHSLKLEGNLVVSNYRFPQDVKAGDWGYLYDEVARATVSTMEDILKDAKFKNAEIASLRFQIWGVDKYGKEGVFQIAEFNIPMAEWKKYSTKITGDWLLIAPILKQFYYKGDSRFEKNLRNQKEYGS